MGPSGYEAIQVEHDDGQGSGAKEGVVQHSKVRDSESGAENKTRNVYAREKRALRSEKKNQI